MLRQLLVGAAVSLGNIAIHALVMTAVVRVALAVKFEERVEPVAGAGSAS